MATATPLTGQQIAASYGSVIQLGNSGVGLTNLPSPLADGLGNVSPLNLSTTAVSLGTPGVTSGGLQFFNANNMNSVVIKAPNTSSTYVLSLPPNRGTAGQILSTDGTGATSWITAVGSGTVTNVSAGTGLTGGPIITSGTLALDLANLNTWTGAQTFDHIVITSGSGSPGGTATIKGTGGGDMSISWRGVQGGANDIRMGTQLVYPLALQGGIANFPSANEHVVIGEGNDVSGPYSRIEYGWQSANPGWYSFHEESGVMPDTIPAPGGLPAKPMSWGLADHTNGKFCTHVTAGSNGAIVDDFTSVGGGITPLSGRVGVLGSWWWGLRHFTVDEFTYDYDGYEMQYLQPQVPTTTGHHDSHTIVWAGTWNAGGGTSDYHTADWKWRTNVTDNSGTNAFLLETRTDANSYVPKVTVNSAGKMIIGALQISTSPTNGYVLTSDASGNGTWQAPSGGGGVTIGGAVSGGTNNCALFVDGSGNLGQSTSFKFDGSAGTFVTGTATTTGLGITTLSTTMSGTSALSNFLNITGTLPTSPVASCYALDMEITTAGSAAQQQGLMSLTLGPGYTGSNYSIGVIINNGVAGTGTDYLGGTGNYGIYAICGSNTTGTHTGIYCLATNGLINVGMSANATTAKNSGKNIGVAAFALNTGSSPTHVAGYFGLQSSAPTFANCALCADNGATSDPIALFRVNGTTKVTIDSAGDIVMADGTILQIGNAATTGLSAGVLAGQTNASLVINDKNGQAYRIPCII